MDQPRKRKPAALRRTEIIDTVIRLSLAIGPDRVTTQQVAEEIGITQPAIFRHFATKADIWTAVAKRITEEMSAAHKETVVRSDTDSRALLKEIAKAHFTHIQANPAVPAIVFSRELSAENDALRERFGEFFAERQAILERIIRAAQESGDHRDDLDAEESARLLLASIQGTSIRWLQEDRQFDLPDVGGRMIGALIDGFRV